MQNSPLDTILPQDTAKKDSIFLVSPEDTIHKDSSATEPQKDPIIDTSAQKKDTLPAIEKKAVGKAPVKDTLAKKPIVSSVTDTPQMAEPVVSDTFYSDTTLLVTEDTAACIPVQEQAESENFSGNLRNAENNTWIILILVIIFSILAWMKVAYSRRLRQLFEAFLSNRHIRQMVREEFVFSHPASVVLTFSFTISSSLLLTQANGYFQWKIFEGGSILVFLKFLGMVGFFYFSKALLIRLSATLFAIREEITEYLFNLFLFNNILGLLLLPFAISAAFFTVLSPEKILIASGILALLVFLFRLVKSTFIGLASTKFSILYIILYICTLEILPLVVVIKAFIQSI